MSRPPLPVATRRLVWERDEGKCQKCGAVEDSGPDEPSRLQVAHIEPWSKCQAHELENLTLLCRECHPDWHAAERAGISFEDWLHGRAKAERKPNRFPARGIKPGPIRRGYVKVTVLLEEEDAEWGKRQRGGLSELFRRLLREVRKREGLE